MIDNRISPAFNKAYEYNLNKDRTVGQCTGEKKSSCKCRAEQNKRERFIVQNTGRAIVANGLKGSDNYRWPRVVEDLCPTYQPERIVVQLAPWSYIVTLFPKDMKDA